MGSGDIPNDWPDGELGYMLPDGTFRSPVTVHPPRRSCWRQEVLDGEPLSAIDLARLLYQDERTIRNWASDTFRRRKAELLYEGQDERYVYGSEWDRDLPLLHTPGLNGEPVTLLDGSRVAILKQGAKGRGKPWQFALVEPTEASSHYFSRQVVDVRP
jgi:hypothetical protein